MVVQQQVQSQDPTEAQQAEDELRIIRQAADILEEFRRYLSWREQEVAHVE